MNKSRDQEGTQSIVLPEREREMEITNNLFVSCKIQLDFFLKFT